MNIFYDEMEDDEVRSAVDRSTALIQARGGTPGKVEWWGKRHFAYEMKHRWEWFYVLLDAEAEPAAMAELDRSLFLADEVLRHKLIRLPDHVAERRRSAAAAGPAGGSPASQPANGA